MRASFDFTDPAWLLNRAACYADGLFESVRKSPRGLPLWSLHMQRMLDGLARLDIAAPDADALQQQALEMTSEMPHAGVRLLVFRSGLQRGYAGTTRAAEWVMQAEPLPALSDAENGEKLGVSAVRLAAQPALAGLKHLARTEQVLASRSIEPGCDDALLLDHRGRVIESTFRNLLCVRGESLVTPDLRRCGVHGVALRWLQQHHTVRSEDMPLESLLDSDGVLLCNALRGFSWVKEIKNLGKCGHRPACHAKIQREWRQVFE